MTSETDDDKFIAWAQKKVGIYLTDKDEDRLFALARRGTAAADRIERLEKIINVAVTYLHDAGASESAFSVDEMKDRAALEERT